MKRILSTTVALFLTVAVFAQLNPVSWSFTSKKISDKVYEIHLVAKMQSGWHLYSQNQPKDAINLPTKVSFANSPLASLDGVAKEVGKMQVYKDKATESTAHQYSGTVKFVQKVTLKSGAKPTITGNVEYQTCDDKQCLPPKKVPFSIKLS